MLTESNKIQKTLVLTEPKFNYRATVDISEIAKESNYRDGQVHLASSSPQLDQHMEADEQHLPGSPSCQPPLHPGSD
jgi:hypothetical protein